MAVQTSCTGLFVTSVRLFNIKFCLHRFPIVHFYLKELLQSCLGNHTLFKMVESTYINGALVFLQSKQFKLCRWRLRPLLPPSSETSSCQVTRLETSPSPSQASRNCQITIIITITSNNKLSDHHQHHKKNFTRSPPLSTATTIVAGTSVPSASS